MARVCTVTGKKPLFGNKVSHANNKNRRRWQPNLQMCSFPSEALGRMIQLRLTANGIRTVEHNGGLDAWIMSLRPAKLHEDVLEIRKQITRAIGRKTQA